MPSLAPSALTSYSRPLCHAFTLVSLLAASGANAQGDSPTNTSVAMIILYAITGCVSALFCVVIISGAVRAIRHPERYGPRNADGSYAGIPGQSRARGLTRAILDTFPVVKFGGEQDAGGAERPKDIENGDIELEDSVDLKHDLSKDGEDVTDLQTWEVVDGSRVPVNMIKINDSQPQENGGVDDVGADGLTAAAVIDAEETSGAGPSTPDSTLAVRPRLRPGRSEVGKAEAPSEQKEVVPDAIGTETCPICIVDFEEGDDLRVLPCEGHHRFHRDCVDQWLLELSSSCPICRQDFHALEAMMMAGEAGDQLEPPPHFSTASSRPMSTAAARFSRYLRFARRRHRDREDGRDYDATDPPMPLSPDMRF